MGNKTDSDYRTISVRLPRQEFIDFDRLCSETHSTKLREIIQKEIKKGSKNKIFAGTNKLQYNKINNSFSWFVQLDSGEEVEVFSNFSLEFLKNFQQEIQGAIKERNQWVHQTKENSIEIPINLMVAE